MDAQNQNPNVHTELSRDMGLTTILAIGVGTMIAAGIFTLSGIAIGNVGSAAILSFFLAAVVATFTALTYCEFVSIYPNSGEGYLYARKTFPAPLAYFVGWALVLGYASSCAFYISSLSTFFYEFIFETPFKALSGLICLVGLIFLNIKGTKESGRFQVIVTLGKVLLLAIFIIGGIQSVDTGELIAKFSTDAVEIVSTSALVFITFFGFSAIAATAGEVKNPVKNIPKAIFLSMGLVTFIYVFVIVVMIAANMNEYTEAAMGDVAEKFLGPIGGLVIVGGGIFSMISATNASIIAGSRITLAMSQLGHFPKAFGSISPKTKTPIVAVMLLGGTIMLFVVSLPDTEAMASFANTVLLQVLILVNVGLIYHRRKYPDIKRPFKVPLVPLLPALGILANLYLLVQLVKHPVPFTLAIICLILGMIGFLIWKGSQAEETAIEGERSRVALGRYSNKEGKFRILVPISNPRNVDKLIELAAAIGNEREGEIVALRVLTVPAQIAPSQEDLEIAKEQEILDIAHRAAKEHGALITSILRIGHNAARAILETAREHECNLILMGWKGFPNTAQMILGEVTDAVVRNAKTDIMLVKLGENDSMKNILLPSAGGAHAKKAGEYVASIAKTFGGALTMGAVLSPDAPEGNLKETTERLNTSLAQLSKDSGLEVGSKIIKHNSIAEGVIEAAEDYDTVVVGAAGYGYFKQILFGSIPETIAKKTNKSVILVRNYHPVKSLIERIMGE